MLKTTRQKYNAFVSQIALLNEVDDATKKFAVAPVIEQKLEQSIQDSSAFLKNINFVPVTDQSGTKVGVGVSGTIAGRTDTSANDRTPRAMEDTKSRGYACQKTEFDTAQPYTRLDAWAHKPNFEILLKNAITTQQGLDRIMIGFNGVSIAAETDRATYPLLQDVNKGWLQKIREEAAAQRMNAIKIGAPGGAIAGEEDYKNLDAAVLDALDLLHPTVRGNPNLVVICSNELLSDKYVSLAGDSNVATEREAFAKLLSNKKLGGKPVVEAPYFPLGAFLITTLDNLSIYYQSGSRRRTIVDNAKRDQIEDFQSVNEDYIIEVSEGVAFVEGILVPNAGETAWE